MRIEGELNYIGQMLPKEVRNSIDRGLDGESRHPDFDLFKDPQYNQPRLLETSRHLLYYLHSGVRNFELIGATAQIELRNLISQNTKQTEECVNAMIGAGRILIPYAKRRVDVDEERWYLNSDAFSSEIFTEVCDALKMTA